MAENYLWEQFFKPYNPRELKWVHNFKGCQECMMISPSSSAAITMMSSYAFGAVEAENGIWK